METSRRETTRQRARVRWKPGVDASPKILPELSAERRTPSRPGRPRPPLSETGICWYPTRVSGLLKGVVPREIQALVPMGEEGFFIAGPVAREPCMENIRIRKALPEDAEAITALWMDSLRLHSRYDERFVLHPQAETAWRAALRLWMESADACVLAAETAGGELIAFAIGMDRENAPILQPERYGYISELDVAEGWRRRGVGRRLFGELMRWFAQRRLTTYRLNAAHRNPLSQAFWRAVGAQDFIDVLWGEVP